MGTPRIYQCQSLSTGADIVLDKEASHYLLNVLRKGTGENVILFDGNGHEYSGVISNNQKKILTVTLQKSIEHVTESPIYLHLVQGLTRGEKMDFILQKAVELGVNKITPLFTEFCNVKLSGDRLKRRMMHWKKVIISACEQSKRNILPLMEEPISFMEWISSCEETSKLLFHPSGEIVLSECDLSVKASLVIGPEGGFSEKEILQAKNHDFAIVNLGPRILRTETAGITALAAVQCLYGDLG